MLQYRVCKNENLTILDVMFEKEHTKRTDWTCIDAKLEERYVTFQLLHDHDRVRATVFEIRNKMLLERFLQAVGLKKLHSPNNKREQLSHTWIVFCFVTDLLDEFERWFELRPRNLRKGDLCFHYIVYDIKAQTKCASCPLSYLLIRKHPAKQHEYRVSLCGVLPHHFIMDEFEPTCQTVDSRRV